MKHLFSFFIAASTITLLCNGCARRCPADINLGNIDLQPATLAFLPAAQRVKSMVFTNAAGNTLEFTALDGWGESRFPYSVETLCERGEFLDKTVQTADFQAQAFHYDYRTPGNTFTLNIDLMPQSSGTYGNRKDTIFYETFSVWGQKLTEPTQVGSLTVLTDERGNSANISETLRINTNHYQIVADTVLNGRAIQQAWVPANDGKQSLFVFYTKTGGIVAFTTVNGEVWVRQY